MINKVRHWMPLNIGELLAETMGLTNEELGAYMRLRMAYWHKGGPLTDAEAKAVIRQVMPVVANYFKIKGGFWRHIGLDAELKTAKNNQLAASAKGRNAIQARWNKARQRVDSSILQVYSENTSGDTKSIPGDTSVPVPVPVPPGGGPPAPPIAARPGQVLWDGDYVYKPALRKDLKELDEKIRKAQPGVHRNELRLRREAMSNALLGVKKAAPPPPAAPKPPPIPTEPLSDEERDKGWDDVQKAVSSAVPVRGR